MTIDNDCGGDDRLDSFPASHAEAHSRVAMERSALFAAHRAIARWANGAAPRMGQADWYAESQQNFQQWLARGGFAQHCDECADLVAPTMYSIGAAAAQPAPSDVPSAAA